MHVVFLAHWEESEGVWIASCCGLRGVVVTYSPTLEGLKHRARDALQVHLALFAKTARITIIT